MKLKNKLIAGMLAAAFSVGVVAPGMAMAADKADPDGVYRWESREEIEDANVKEITVNYTEKANSGELQTINSIVVGNKMTVQLKTSADGILRLHYSKNGGKTFTKMNIEKVIRTKMGLSADQSFDIYDLKFFGDLFTMTGYYYDEEEVKFFVLASSDMKTFLRRDMPGIENSGNNSPHLYKIGKQYIWCARQSYWPEDSKSAGEYRCTYYAGTVLSALKKKTITAQSPFAGEELSGVNVWSGVSKNQGMVLIYSSYDPETGYLSAARMLFSNDLKKWSEPIDIFDNERWNYGVQVSDGAIVLYNRIETSGEDGYSHHFISTKAYDGEGKEIGFCATMLGVLDMDFSVYTTTKAGELQYITIFDCNDYSSNSSLAFAIAKDGTLTARKLPFMYNDGYRDGIRFVTEDKKNGVLFLGDYSGNVYMSKDGFSSLVTFKMPEDGEGILDFNVVGDYLFFESAQKNYKVKLSTLYKNFE